MLVIIIFGTLSFPIVLPGKKTDFSITDAECRIFFSKVPWLVPAREKRKKLSICDGEQLELTSAVRS